MNYGLITKPTLKTSECLVFGIFSDYILPDFATMIDKKQNGLLTCLCSKLTTKDDMVWQTDIDDHSLMIIFCGAQAEFTANVLTKQINNITTTLLKQGVVSVTICMPQLTKHTPDWQLQHMLLQFDYQCYQLLEFKSKDKTPYYLESIQFYQPGAHNLTLKSAQAIAESVQLTRTLANLPANVCTPTYLAKQAIQLAQQHDKFQTKIIHRKKMEQMGMGALLSVAKGSHEPPQLIEIHYRGGASDESPIILVGKGITFDSGGISLKGPENMNEMKYDMAGAASVLGTLKACAMLKLPIHVIGLLACAENMPSGTASRPGDIVTSMSGLTIEITNTDAEGRLVLADALTYAERFKPDMVIDIATLTMSVILALGDLRTGFMTKDEELANLIQTAAVESEDYVWRMPLDQAYHAALSSPLADLVNAPSGRKAGCIIAACFLSNFTDKYRWAHLDVAGTAWIPGKDNAATGRPVTLLIQLLRHVANSR